MKDRTRRFILAGWAAAAVSLLLVPTLLLLPRQDVLWPWPVGLSAFPVAAALILARRPGNAVGRALGGVGLAGTIVLALDLFAETTSAGALSARAAEAVGTSAVIALFGSLLLLIHVFPAGRPIGPRHALVIRALWVWWGIAGVAALLRPGPMDFSGHENPFGVGGDVTRAVMDIALWFLPVFAVLGVIVLAIRHRRADAVERAQLKWFLAAAFVVLLMIVMISLWSGDGPALVEFLAGLFVVTAFWSLPVATVVAVTRYGLFEIDRIVSRTATYGVVGGVLGGVYAGSVVVLQRALPVGSSSVAVAASTLAAAALFSPVRRRVQHALNRRFNRSRYESDLVVQRFALQLRLNPALDTDAIHRDLADVVRTTLQPQGVHLWLAGARRI